MEWLGEQYEAPDTAVLVGLPIEDALRMGATIDGIEVVEEMTDESNVTFDHRNDRLRLLVIDGVVAAAART